MNLVHEQVRHRQFGIGSITEQAEKIITVKFSDEYGIKRFQYPLAFDQYLILCNAGLQSIIHAEARLLAEQIESERKRKEEEYRRKEEERIKNNRSRQTTPKKKRSRKKQHKKVFLNI